MRGVLFTRVKGRQFRSAKISHNSEVQKLYDVQGLEEIKWRQEKEELAKAGVYFSSDEEFGAENPETTQVLIGSFLSLFRDGPNFS